MDLKSIFEISGAIIASLGGAGALIIALSSYIGKLWASKILEADRQKYQQELQKLIHNLSVRKTAYEKYLDLIVNYHDLIYKHYRLCQQTEHADIIRHPEQGEYSTKEDFMEKIDNFVEEMGSVEGKLRIILPQEILDIHNELVGDFNEFKDIVKKFDNSSESSDRHKLNEAMKNIVSRQKLLEQSIRNLLRTQDVLV